MLSLVLHPWSGHGADLWLLVVGMGGAMGNRFCLSLGLPWPYLFGYQ